MQRRRHVITTLRPLVGRRVQGPISLPCSGFFSPFPLTVLVRYRSLGVFSLTGWAPLIHARFLVPATQDTTRLRKVMYRAFTVYGRLFQVVPFPFLLATSWSYNPVSPRRHGFGSSVFSPLLYGIIVYFLLLWVLRCFSSPRSPPLRDGRPSACRVAPFGYPGINGYFALFAAYHVLRRLREPRHPPSALAYFLSPRT